MPDHRVAADWRAVDSAPVDVALVDAVDEREDANHLSSVGVVEAISAVRTPNETTVVVVTAHFFDDAPQTRM